MPDGEKVEGKAKELQGKLTDDKSRQVEGKAQQAKADAANAGEQIKKDVSQ